MMVHFVVGGGAKEREKFSGTASPSCMTFRLDFVMGGEDSSGKKL